jgi:hypothetical protein
VPRNESFERAAAADHAKQLLALLRKGQRLDASVDARYTLRDWLESLHYELDTTLASKRNLSTGTRIGVTVALGLAIGASVGVAVHALAMGVAIGAVAGVVLSAVIARG